MTNRLHTNKWHRLDYAARRKRGQCAHCAAQARPNKATCPDCGKRQSRVSVQRKQKLRPILIKLGICTQCETRKAIDPGKVLRCAACAEAEIERTVGKRHAWGAAGLCTGCGGDPGKLKRCRACNDAANLARAKRLHPERFTKENDHAA